MDFSAAWQAVLDACDIEAACLKEMKNSWTGTRSAGRSSCFPRLRASGQAAADIRGSPAGISPI